MSQLIKYLSNVPGWRTRRKIVVLESDDWGSIRMPSRETRNRLSKEGLPVDRSRYNRYDSLECNGDLEALFEVVSGFTDRKGNHPAITALCVTANPDFEKIEKEGFGAYYFEPVSRTLARYPAHDRVLELWREGYKKRLFVPQFHGREHLNVQRWMRDLQSGRKETMLAFRNRLWGIGLPGEDGYQAAFDLDDLSDLSTMRSAITGGLDLFADLMDYRAEYFVPANGPFNLELLTDLHDGGIRFLTLDKRQKEPLGNGRYRNHIHYPGQRSRYGQIFLSRNAAFEPSGEERADWTGRCLNSIRIAFRMMKPAVVSTHRVNFTGFLEPQNRERGLAQLGDLLKKILKTWPDVEFMTSVELGELVGGVEAVHERKTEARV